MIIIYLLAAMVVTPIVMEYVNTKKGWAPDKVQIWISGLPAYVLNLFICAVEGLIAMWLPGGPRCDASTFWLWLVFTALIYLGNQLVFNVFIKLLAKARQQFQ